MSTDVASEVLSDGFSILTNSEEFDNENDGTLRGASAPMGLSNVPNLHGNDLVDVSNDYRIERTRPNYNPEFKDDTYTLQAWARYFELKKDKYDTREFEATGEMLPVQKKSKIGDDNGRLGRYITEFTRKQQRHMRIELCKLETQMMSYSPLWFDLTTTPYIYKLQKRGKKTAVSDFCKDGLKRWRERLRRHDQMQHLTGMYKWEFTKSELPHLHIIAWFDKWTGDPNLKEHQFIDLEWFARSWFESLFPTKELQEENIKHLKAGTRVDKVRGYSKRHAQNKLIRKVESYPQEQLEKDLRELQDMSESDFTDVMKLGGKGGAWEKATNYLTKYITKEMQDTPEGWGNSRFHGVINRNAFKSYQPSKLWKRITKEEGEAIHTACVKVENQRVISHVRHSKYLDYLIKRREKRIYIQDVDYVGTCLDGTEQPLNEIEPLNVNGMEGGIFRTFHERWQTDLKPEDLIDEDGKPKRDKWGNLIKATRFKGWVKHEDEGLLDDEGNPKLYILELFDCVYDIDRNFIGIYKEVSSREKVLDTDDLTHYESWTDPDDGSEKQIKQWRDLETGLELEFVQGIDVDGFQTKHQFLLISNDGEVLETHDEWNDLRGRRIKNEDEYRYCNSKSMYGVNCDDILRLAFPNNSIETIVHDVEKVPLGQKNQYFTEVIHAWLNIKPLLTIEQEAQDLMIRSQAS